MNLLAALAGLLLAALVPLPLLAQTVPTIPCAGLPGCPKPPDISVLEGLIPKVAALLLMIAAGATVIYIILAGMHMVMSSEEGAAKGKTGVLYALGGLGLCLAATTIVAAVATEVPSGSQDLIIAVMQTVTRVILTFFNVFFAISVIYGGYQMVMAGGKSEGYEKGIGRLKWSIAGAILVNSARAIVQAFLNLEL